MSERSIEAHGVDVDAAIAAGLQQLGLTQDQVIVEVVDEGRRGLLGLGSREATVRLTPLPRPSAPAPAGRTQTSEAPAPAARREAREPAARPAEKPARQPSPHDRDCDPQAGARINAENEGVCQRIAEHGLHLQTRSTERHAG